MDTQMDTAIDIRLIHEWLIGSYERTYKEQVKRAIVNRKSLKRAIARHERGIIKTWIRRIAWKVIRVTQ